MVNFRNALVIAGALMFAQASAVAQDDAYSAQDVIAHFERSVDLGETRGLCIGTPSECGEVQPAPQPEPFNLRVQFELNSAELTPQARGRLDAFATAASSARLRRAYFNIDGHTDALGEDRVNQNLSERRAAAVVSYLVDRGVSPDKLVPKGFGESQPLSDDPYADVNRRVEASLAGLR